jgi:ribose transport system substrate-binding protein
MKRSLSLALAVLIMLSVLAVSASAQAKGRYSDQLYVEVSALNSLEYFYDHKEGMRIVGEDLGVKTEYTGPADYDMNAVAAAVDQAIAKKAAGIVIVGWEESLNGAIKKATDAGIPVVTCDADLPTSARVAFVGTSNYSAGQDLAKWWIKKLNGKGKIALVGMPTLSNIRDRIEGMKAVFATSQIQIVTIGDSKTDAVGSAATATAILQKYPDLNGMIGVDSHSGLGIGTAVREAGKAGKIIVTGWDRDNSLLELIDKGIVQGTVVQRTALMPYYSVLILWQMYNSKVALTTNDKAAKINTIPGFVDTGIMIVEKEQAKNFIRKK